MLPSLGWPLKSPSSPILPLLIALIGTTIATSLLYPKRAQSKQDTRLPPWYPRAGKSHDREPKNIFVAWTIRKQEAAHKGNKSRPQKNGAIALRSSKIRKPIKRPSTRSTPRERTAVAPASAILSTTLSPPLKIKRCGLIKQT
ncbi:unnamed protein product [Ectocarpus sp. 12 AP-2014]